jgi:hypothetical protein
MQGPGSALGPTKAATRLHDGETGPRVQHRKACARHGKEHGQTGKSKDTGTTLPSAGSTKLYDLARLRSDGLAVERVGHFEK